MNSVFYFSGSGNSKKVADYMAKNLNCNGVDLTSFNSRNSYVKEDLEVAIITMPIYGQSLADPIKEMLQMINASYYVLLFTYGKMGVGNVLQDALEYLENPVIAAAIIPGNHSYKDIGDFTEFEKLDVIINKIKNKDFTKIDLPRHPKSVFAAVFPKARMQMNVKIKVDKNLCDECGVCNEVCPVKGIDLGITNDNCIRCLKCVHSCPTKALYTKNNPLLDVYLSKIRDTQLYLYL